MIIANNGTMTPTAIQFFTVNDPEARPVRMTTAIVAPMMIAHMISVETAMISIAIAFTGRFYVTLQGRGPDSSARWTLPDSLTSLAARTIAEW
jgi:hypothetical protein